MRHPNRRDAAVLLLVLLAAAACGRAVQEPEVRLDGVTVRTLGLQGGMLGVRLAIHNPNGFAIQTRALNYEIELGEIAETDPTWIELTEGTYDEPVHIPARDSVTVEIPVEFTYRGLGGAIRSILDTGSFRYRARGSVAIDRPIRRSIPFRREGTVAVFGGG